MTLLRTGLECLDTFGVLFNVGAAELNFERSKFELELVFVPCRSPLTTSRNVTAMLFVGGCKVDMKSAQVRFAQGGTCRLRKSPGICFQTKLGFCMQTKSE